MANAPVQPDATRETLAVECLNASSKRERDFIAMALSGGGTKAAVFSAEAMFYLEALDLLHRVSVVSAVSGGSFTAGLYALSCEPNDLAPTAYNAACKPGTQAIRAARYGNTPTF
jgi:predicted acylesterase/phospholipase RssA